jgi:hypothetical protein
MLLLAGDRDTRSARSADQRIFDPGHTVRAADSRLGKEAEEDRYEACDGVSVLRRVQPQNAQEEAALSRLIAAGPRGEGEADTGQCTFCCLFVILFSHAFCCRSRCCNIHNGAEVTERRADPLR